MEPSNPHSLQMVWINEQIVAENEVRISPFDHGLLTGDGVFETMVAHDSLPFAFTRHYQRLQKSASRFGLQVPSAEVLRRACVDVADANGLVSARIRVTVTGGTAPLGSEKGNAPETIIVAAGELPHQPEVTQIVTVPYTRNENGALVGIKTTSYGENVVALSYAHKNGAREAIFGNVAGMLCEGTGSNIFIIRNGELITPPLSAGCLPGVTRALVLDICASEDIQVHEVDTPLTELKDVESAFLTSTLRGVQPVATVDGVELKDAREGVVARIQAAFNTLSSEKSDP